MSERNHSQIINDMRPFLVNNIDVINTSLLDELVTEEVICDTQFRSIRETYHRNHQQVSELLSIIQRKPEADFHRFRDCLIKTGQGHISKKLADERTQDTGRRHGEEIYSKWDPASVILEMPESYTQEQESIIECMIQNLTLVQQLDENIRIQRKSGVTELPVSKTTHIVRVLPDVEQADQMPTGKHLSNVIMKSVQEYGGIDLAAECRTKYLAVGKCKQNFFLGYSLFRSWRNCLTHGDDHTVFIPAPVYGDPDMLADPTSEETISTLVADLDTSWETAVGTVDTLSEALRRLPESRNLRLYFTISTECTFQDNLTELLQRKLNECMLGNAFELVPATKMHALSALKDRSIWLFLHPARYLTCIRMLPVVNAIPHVIAAGTELDQMYKSITPELKEHFILKRLNGRALSQMIGALLEEGSTAYAKARRLSEAFHNTPDVLHSHAEFLQVCLGNYITTFAVEIKTKDTSSNLSRKEESIVSKLNQIIGQMHTAARRSQSFEPESPTANRVFMLLKVLKLVLNCVSGSITLHSYISRSVTIDGLQEAIRDGRILCDTRNVLHLLLRDCSGLDSDIVKIKMRMIPSVVAKESGYVEVKNEKRFNQGYQDQGTNLMRAVRANDLQRARILVNQGADVNYVTEENLTPLGLAVSENYMELANQLVEQGADLELANVEDCPGLKPYRGYLPAEKKLEVKKRKLDKPNSLSWSSRPFLHFLVAFGSPWLTNKYLNLGGDVNQTDQKEATALHLAAYMGETQIARVLLEHGADIHKKTKDICSPLCMAIIRDEDHVVRILLTKGSDVNEGRLSPFFIALLRENIDMILNFIKSGARLIYTGYTSLHLVAEIGLAKPIGLLIRSGVNVDKKTSDGLTALHLAARRGHTDTVKGLLEGGADIEATTTKGVTLLEIATLNNKTDILEVLLEHGANVERAGSMGKASLELALRNNNTGAIRILLKHGANPNMQRENGLSPLVSAVNTNNTEAVYVLLDHGANPNVPVSGLPPLLHAMHMNNTNSVRMLLDYGANINIRSVMNPLFHAVLQNKTDFMSILLEYEADLNIVIKDILTPLVLAISENNTFAMQMLLAHGADPDLKIVNRPLAFAICQNRTEAVKVLLDHGADPNKADVVGNLFTALYINNNDVIRILLEHGADPNMQSYGQGPLSGAADLGNTDAVLLLLKHGADPNAGGKMQIPPLFTAICKNNLDILQVLLKNGADTSVKDNCGHTPLHLAARIGLDTAVEILLQKGADVNSLDQNRFTPLHLAMGHLKTMEVLLKMGADVEAGDKIPGTALHMASFFGDSESMNILMKYGANINAKTIYLDTPLHLAASKGQGKAMEILLKMGADVNSKDMFGRTTLHIAAGVDIRQPVLILLRNGADLEAKTMLTPLHIAALYGNPQVLDVLINNGANVEAKAEIVVFRDVTALHIARYKGHRNAERILLRYGAKSTDYDPLHTRGLISIIEKYPRGYQHFSGLKESCTTQESIKENELATREARNQQKSNYQTSDIKTSVTYAVTTRMPGNLTKTVTQFDLEQHLNTFHEKVYKKLLEKMNLTETKVDRQMQI